MSHMCPGCVKHPGRVPIDFAKTDRASAKMLDTAANIASGHGEYALANQIWALAERVRRQARERKEKQMVCPDCGMTTWKDGFGCVLPGCENYGVLTTAGGEKDADSDTAPTQE